LHGNWQDFNWHDASRGPLAIAELLVSVAVRIVHFPYIFLSFIDIFAKHQQLTFLTQPVFYYSVFVTFNNTLKHKSPENFKPDTPEFYFILTAICQCRIYGTDRQK